MSNWWWRDRRAEITGRRPIDYDLKFYSEYARMAVGKPSRAERFVKLFIWSSLFFYAAWCVFDRNMGTYPTTVLSAQATNLNVAPGENLYVHFELVRNKICEFDLAWSVRDASGRNYSFVEPHRNATGSTGPDSSTRPFSMPTELSPGRARLRLISSWACPANFYEAIYPKTLILPDIYFNVTAPKGEP